MNPWPSQRHQEIAADKVDEEAGIAYSCHMQHHHSHHNDDTDWANSNFRQPSTTLSASPRYLPVKPPDWLVAETRTHRFPVVDGKNEANGSSCYGSHPSRHPSFFHEKSSQGRLSLQMDTKQFVCLWQISMFLVPSNLFMSKIYSYTQNTFLLYKVKTVKVQSPGQWKALGQSCRYSIPQQTETTWSTVWWPWQDNKHQSSIKWNPFLGCFLVTFHILH
jgi:hypothetical protein